MATRVLSATVDEALADRLEHLASETSRKKSYFVNQALKEYFMALDDPQADLLMTTTSEHGTQPGGWTRSEGQGRVCVLTPGHNIAVWLHPSFQALLRNALRWCAPLNLRP